MGIDAVALLRGIDHTLPPNLHVRKLEDALLVSTGVRFGGAPDELGLGVRAALGEALDAHQDARGVFVIPDVAEPRAKTYDGVIAEIGEAGEWAPIVAAGHVPERFAGAPADSFAGLVGQMMTALGEGTLAEMQRAMATGDLAALERVQHKLVSALGGEEQIEALGRKIAAAAEAESSARPDPLAGLPPLPIQMDEIDLQSPDMAALLQQVEQQLDADPERRAALEKMLREAGVEDGEDDADDAADDAGPAKKP
ncbi:MAG: hypothetical protein QM820_29400 [Minicystis sp.]